MLVCDCGWVGVNLSPDKKRDVACCPSCGIVFKGFTSEQAIIVSDESEAEVVRDYNVLKVMVKILGDE